MKLGVNLRISKILRGQIIIFENFEGSICNFLEINWVQITKFEKNEDQDANFEQI